MMRTLQLLVPAIISLGPCEPTDTGPSDTGIDNEAPIGERLVFETATQGLCADGVDDDDDGLIDCDDPGCSGSSGCHPFPNRDVSWPPDPPNLDIVQQERESCVQPALTDWICGRGHGATFNCQYGARGARGGVDADLHLTCEDSGGLNYFLLTDLYTFPSAASNPQQPTLMPVEDPTEPGAPIACGAVMSDHPLARSNALFTDTDDAFLWQQLDVALPVVLTSPMHAESCDSRPDTGLTVVAYRDDVEPERATVVISGHGSPRVLLPEVRGRDTRVTVVPDGADTWVAVSSEGDCTVPCVYHLQGGTVVIPKPVTWAPGWRQPTLSPAGVGEPGSFWVDDDGVPTITWSGYTAANESVRGVARLNADTWTGQELLCPDDVDDRPTLSAVVDLGDAWITGGTGDLYRVDPETLLAERITAPAESALTYDLLALRGPGRFSPQGRVWASARTTFEEGLFSVQCDLP